MNKLLFRHITRIMLVSCFVSLFAGGAKATMYFEVPYGGGDFSIRTKTLQDNRYYHILHQRFDFSCGSATLASLLTFHYHRPTDERKIIKVMYDAGDRNKIEREGFSLLDMKNYLASIGLRANGYHESLDTLARVGVPAIVLINRKGYMHFVLVQGITRDKVLIGDPARGKTIMTRKKFDSLWVNHVLFVVENEANDARRTFNTNVAWHVKKPGKFVMPIPNTDLAASTLLTSFTPNTFAANK